MNLLSATNLAQGVSIVWRKVPFDGKPLTRLYTGPDQKGRILTIRQGDTVGDMYHEATHLKTMTGWVVENV